MQKSVEIIEGDTVGIAYTLPVYRFAGSDPAAAAAYIQAALHGDELPGVVAIDALLPQLLEAEEEGRIRGRITVVPFANPIGRSQYLFGDHQGRFHLGSRTNFNRDFPLLDGPQAEIPSSRDLTVPADQRLKRRLLELSLGHDIILDLHCDDEGVPYLYVPKALWPQMADVAAAMNMQAVVLWDGGSGASFDEASVNPYLGQPAQDLAKRVVTTVEYRGQADVSAELARHDADGIYRVLARRGVIEDAAAGAPADYTGLAAPIENVEMVKARRAGAVLFHVQPGDRVKAGALLATVIAEPGEPDGRDEIHAPQDGFVLTRRVRRAVTAGDDLVKLVGKQASAVAKSGALED
ncbi:peptidase M14 [Salmonella enterica subsp. enterica serovar Virchow]|nr:peptidase M14 [Salmonella enterica subsp. enterica serovar Virchow]